MFLLCKAGSEQRERSQRNQYVLSQM